MSYDSGCFDVLMRVQSLINLHKIRKFALPMTSTRRASFQIVSRAILIFKAVNKFIASAQNESSRSQAPRFEVF